MAEAVSQNLVVAGDVLSVSDAMKLVDRIYARAAEIAGQFYENERSAKFRGNWKNADEYAEANKHTFIAQARADFTTLLGNPKTDPGEARRVYLALLLERAFAEGLKSMGREA